MIEYLLSHPDEYVREVAAMAAAQGIIISGFKETSLRGDYLFLVPNHQLKAMQKIVNSVKGF